MSAARRVRLWPFARPVFSAGIARIELVDPVLDSREVVVDAVRFGGIEIVVDGDVADAVLWEGEIGVKSCQSRISTQVCMSVSTGVEILR